MKRAKKDPIVISIAVLGMLLTLFAVALIRQDEQREATRWLSERAELIARATEDSATATFRDLNSAAAYMASSGTLTQAQFARFVEQLDLNPAVIGIGYVGVVADSEIDDFLTAARADVPDYELLSFDGLGGIAPDDLKRPIYYPLRYVYGGPFLDLVIVETPIESQIDALGFDVATEPLWRPAFERALSIPEPSISDLLEVGGVFDEQAFGIAHPVLDENGTLEGVLVAPGLEILLTADLGISITSNVQWSVENVTTDEISSDWPVWRREVALPGTNWTLTVEPTPQALASLTPTVHWLVVGIGLGLTLLLASTAYQMRVRRRERNEIEHLQRVATDKDRFLAAVSHELRTPLTVVIGLAHELAERGSGFDPEEHAALLEMIGSHGEEAGSIVEDLLVAARADIGKVSVNPERIDLGEIVETTLSGSSLESARMSGDPPTAFADPQRVRQIIRNLLTNANRYGGPNVEIRFLTTHHLAVVEVADDGPPISVDQERRIFDPYTSAHDNGDRLGSIGLGLFISLRLAQLMGGNLTYRHDGCHGLFELTLPREAVSSTAPG